MPIKPTIPRWVFINEESLFCHSHHGNLLVWGCSRNWIHHEITINIMFKNVYGKHHVVEHHELHHDIMTLDTSHVLPYISPWHVYDTDVVFWRLGIYYSVGYAISFGTLPNTFTVTGDFFFDLGITRRRVIYATTPLSISIFLCRHTSIVSGCRLYCHAHENSQVYYYCAYMP